MTERWYSEALEVVCVLVLVVLLACSVGEVMKIALINELYESDPIAEHYCHRLPR
jgi:3-deoxy-D-manno-octulosonic-acid transferase